MPPNDNSVPNETNKIETPSELTDDEVLERCTLTIFQKCLSNELKGFILARSYANLPKQIPVTKLPKKKDDRPNKAYEMRATEIILQNEIFESAITEHDSDSDSDDNMIDLTGNNLPDYFLKQKECRISLCRSIWGVMNMEPEEDLSDDIIETANGIYEILLTRYADHFRLCDCEGKEKHFAFKEWAKQNMA